jgi:hypothetical protein
MVRHLEHNEWTKTGRLLPQFLTVRQIPYTPPSQYFLDFIELSKCGAAGCR